MNFKGHGKRSGVNAIKRTEIPESELGLHDFSLDDSDLKGNAERSDDNPAKFMSPGILSEIMKSSKRKRNEISGDDEPVNIRKVERTAKANNNQEGKYEPANGIIIRPYLKWKVFENVDGTEIERVSHSNRVEPPQQGILGNHQTDKTRPTGNGLPRSVFGSSDESFERILYARNLIKIGNL